jgi:uncharacterized protein YecT (DUF1311 family)
MIRFVSFFAILALLATPALAAPRFQSSLIEPTLEQCITAAATRGNNESGPVLTDCISAGSNACQNEDSNPSSSVIIRCDGEELTFWQALIAFETDQLHKSLKPQGLAALRASEKAWTAWKDARCDLVRKSEPDAKTMGVDVSYCLMETTALRAIDLMVAL